MTRSNSFVKGVVSNSPKRSSIVGGFSQGRSSSFIASSNQGFQSVRTPVSKFTPKAYGSTVTPGSRGIGFFVSLYFVYIIMKLFWHKMLCGLQPNVAHNGLQISNFFPYFIFTIKLKFSEIY